MDPLRSLEQERAQFAYTTINELVMLINADNLDRINNLLKWILEKGNLISEDLLEQLKEKNNLPFGREYQKQLEEKLSSYIKKSAPLILTNGLGSTMAFYLSKMKGEPRYIITIVQDVSTNEGKKKENLDTLKGRLSADKMAYAITYQALNRWLKNNRLLRDSDTVLDWFNDEKTSSLEVLGATQEALALLKWMGRFVQAMLGSEEGGK